jgi:hypothetical protein
MTDFFFFYCSQTASSGSSQTIGTKTIMELDFSSNNIWQCYKKNLIMLKPNAKRKDFQVTESGTAYCYLTRIVVCYHYRNSKDTNLALNQQFF